MRLAEKTSELSGTLFILSLHPSLTNEKHSLDRAVEEAAAADDESEYIS